MFSTVTIALEPIYALYLESNIFLCACRFAAKLVAQKGQKFDTIQEIS